LNFSHTFRIKEALLTRTFAGDDEVKDAVHTWLRSQPKKLSSRMGSDGLRTAKNG